MQLLTCVFFASFPSNPNVVKKMQQVLIINPTRFYICTIISPVRDLNLGTKGVLYYNKNVVPNVRVVILAPELVHNLVMV